MLKGALCALAFMDLEAKAEISLEDQTNYPEFAQVMATSGMGYEWMSYTVFSATGYESKLFRITADPTGTPIVQTKGPVLLLHGMFSEPLDFFNRTDELTAGLPVQLAQ